MEPKRLNKAISETGYCSRREADKLIEQGEVLLNNRIGVLGDKVFINDKIIIEGKKIKLEKEFLYLAFNKPKNIICTTDILEKNNIINYINHPDRIFPIGRLDKDSEGLILLTSDGEIVNKILRSNNNHEKEYVVTVNKIITKDFIQKMSNGISILGNLTKKCIVSQINEFTFKIILTEGKNRQIRRMCNYLGFNVIKLQRIRIMNILLDIPYGKWRYLSINELKAIKKTLSHSKNTK